ncbi:MAG: ATP-binding protein [Pseudomonadota bacterium]
MMRTGDAAPDAETSAALFGLAGARHINLVADLREIGPAVDTVIRGCARPGVEEPVLDAMRLALTEALNNIIEHSAHPSDVPIFVCVVANDTLARICIEDRGRELPRALLTPPAPEPVAEETALDDLADLDALPEGGWGWMLIHASVDRVAHERVNGRNFTLLERSMVVDPERDIAIAPCADIDGEAQSAAAGAHAGAKIEALS